MESRLRHSASALTLLTICMIKKTTRYARVAQDDSWQQPIQAGLDRKLTSSSAANQYLLSPVTITKRPRTHADVLVVYLIPTTIRRLF